MSNNQSTWPVPEDVRLISLTLEQDPNGWAVRLHVEPRVKGRKRSLLRIVDRWYLGPQGTVGTREHLDEVLAEAILQRRLPGLD